jgi:CTP synthase
MVTEEVREKIALFCDVEPRAVIPLVTAPILYEVPLLLEQHSVGDLIVERLGLEVQYAPEWKEWERLIGEVKRSKSKVEIALVGKYVELRDAYFSVREALDHAALATGVEVNISWVQSSDLEKKRSWEKVRQADGIIVPGGFGSRGIEGKIQAIKYAREEGVPYLGLCLGMQLMVVEFARFILNSEEPNSTEFDRSTSYPVIDLMPDQRAITDLGGTMRLGLYPCQLQPGTKAQDAYQVDYVEERHRHRFELNNAYRDTLAKGGMVFPGVSPDNLLVEIAEIENHPFMVGTQFHPEFLSRPNRPHPLFVGFLEATRVHAGLTVKEFESSNSIQETTERNE